ncbi:MAG TPA: DUF2085 domain-containing protein [Thermomicrobiales bacterium]|nr:DUF2085 domain-containing protein [Thermomicrobiales bacterium]
MIAEPRRAVPLTPRAQAIANRIDAAVLWVVTHWLAVFAGYGTMVVGLALLAPLLESSGHQMAARFIYLPFRLICHQRDDRSFHLAGEKLAFCERDVAIVSAAVLTGLLFAVMRHWRAVPRIGFRAVVACALPMAIDGGTQLFGLRESTAELRVLTGTLFSLGAGWFVLPYLETGFAAIRDEIRGRQAMAGRR